MLQQERKSAEIETFRKFTEVSKEMKCQRQERFRSLRT